MASGTIGVRLMTLVFGIIVARALGPSEFGVFMSLLAAAELAGMAGDLGLGTVVSRRVAQVDAEEGLLVLRQAIVARLSLTLLAAIPLAAYVLLTRGVQLVWVTLGLIVYVLVNAVMVLLRQWALGSMKFSPASVSLVVAQATLLVCGIAAAVSGMGIGGLVVAEIAGSAAGLAVLAGGTGVKPRALLGASASRAPRVRELLRQAAPLGIAGALSGVYSRYDVLLVTALAGDLAAGIYAAAYQPFLFACALAQVAYTVMVPVAAKFTTRTDVPDARDGLEDSRHADGFALPVGWIVGLGLYATGPMALRLMFGAKYESSVPVIHLLALAVTFLFYSNVVMARAVAEHRTRLVLSTSVAAVVGTVVLDVVLVPRLGPLGAALTTVVVEAGIGLTLAVLVDSMPWYGFVSRWARVGVLPLAAAALAAFGSLPEWPLLGVVAVMSVPLAKALR